MFSHLERPGRPAPGWREIVTAFGPIYAANGFVGFVFATTAPVAIILSVGTQGNLTEAALASWIFGVFFINGLITILFCWLYRQPLAFFWTIPGSVLVGPALAHLSFPEVIGAFYATGILMLVLGATGWVKKAVERAGGNLAAAARMLGITRPQMVYRLKTRGIVAESE